MAKTIHKQNSIIRGKIKDYDLYTMRCLNVIYYLVQVQKLGNETSNEFSIPMYDMRELMGMQKIGNYAQIIENSLYNLLTEKIYDEYGSEIKDIPFTPQSSKRNSNDEPLEILTELNIIKNHSYICEFQVSEEFIAIATGIDTNFAKIKFSTMNFHSAHTLRFYEYMKSWQGQKFIYLSLDEINETLFFTSYTQLSKVEAIIKRCIKEIKTLNNKNPDIGISYTKDKRRKTFRFTIKTLIDDNKLLQEKRKQDDEKYADEFMKRNQHKL